jgi:PleD family two-component response regulator
MEKGTILVVDNDFETRESIRSLLTDKGYLVQSAPDKLTAIEYMNKDNPDLLIVNSIFDSYSNNEILDKYYNDSHFLTCPSIY